MAQGSVTLGLGGIWQIKSFQILISRFLNSLSAAYCLIGSFYVESADTTTWRSPQLSARVCVWSTQGCHAMISPTFTTILIQPLSFIYAPVNSPARNCHKEPGLWKQNFWELNLASLFRTSGIWGNILNILNSKSS